MILPIVAFGDPVLRKACKAISSDYPDLEDLIASMFETMYDAPGVGLAAPQVGIPIRLFVVDAAPFADDDMTDEEQLLLKGFKKVFINAKIIEERGEEWAFNEGCLSIPDVTEDVFRKEEIVLEYYDASFKKHTETFNGMAARVIQHEFDHIEGVLFTDKLSSLKKRLIKGRLAKISEGRIKVGYRMRFPNQKKKR